MKDYFGSLPEMYSNETSLRLEFAPQKLLVNLETMEVMKLERIVGGGTTTFTIDEAIDACNAL